MNRPLRPVLLSTLLAALVSACGGPSGPISGPAAFAHVANMVAIGARPTGSENLQKTAEYIKGELTKLGLPAREQTFEETVEVYGKPRKLTVRNVWTEIPGSSSDVLLLGAHFDSKLCSGHPDQEHNFSEPFVAAIDGGGASGVLLELARLLKDRQNVPTIWIVWFDGEECVEWDWVTEKAMLGSRHFAETMAADKERFPNGLAARMKAMVLLDLIGSKNIKIDRDTFSSQSLLNIFADAAEQMAMRDRMYRWKSPMQGDDHIPFKNLGVPVIDLIDFQWRTPLPAGKTLADFQDAPAEGEYEVWWHTPKDTLDQMDPASLAFAGNLVWYAMAGIEAEFFAK